MLTLVLLFLLVVPAYAEDGVRAKPQRSLIATASGIKDSTKQVVMTRINAQMNKVNENLTKMWQRLIDRLQELAGKLQTRIDALTADGKDTATAQTALDEANAALITAENAVISQSQKEYAIEFTDENGLRVGATTAKTTLRADLKAVHDLIKTAREKLHAALLAAKQIQGEKNETEE